MSRTCPFHMVFYFADNTRQSRYMSKLCQGMVLVYMATVTPAPRCFHPAALEQDAGS
jgi:hypothetical protein